MILNIKTAMLLPLFIALAVTVRSVFKIELSNYVNNDFGNGRKLRKFKKTLAIPVKRKRKFVAAHSQKISTAWMTFCFVFAVFLGFAFSRSREKNQQTRY